MVDGADTGRLVDVALLLYGKVQRQVQEGVGFALLRRPVVVEVAFDMVEIMVVFGVGFDDAQGFLLEFVQLQRGKALPPYVGKKAAHVVGVYIIHFQVAFGA